MKFIHSAKSIVRPFYVMLIPASIRHLIGKDKASNRAAAWRSFVSTCRNFRVEQARSLKAVRRIAISRGFTYFLDYDKQIATKKREFMSAVSFFKIPLKGQRVLDVGPGTADSLDVAKAEGAAQTLFIEEEPIFVRFAQLKGHTGIRHNYTFTPFFPAGWKGTFDFIYTKGSINCQWVNEQHAKREAGNIDGYFDFDAWVKELIALIQPTGHIVLLPAMWRQPTRIIDEAYDLDTYYWCPDIAAYRASFFTQTLLKYGFRAVDNVPGLTQEQAFPLAFYYGPRA